MDIRMLRGAAVCAAVCALTLSACGRTEASASPTPAPTAVVTQAPTPTPAVYTVEFRKGAEVLSTEQVEEGGTPHLIPAVGGAHFLGWKTETGERADPAAAAIRTDTVYLADWRPFLNEAPAFLFADERGFLRPGALFPAREAAEAIRAMVAEPSDVQDLLDRFDAYPDAELSPADLYAISDRLFLPDAVRRVWVDQPLQNVGVVSRADAAFIFSRLLYSEVPVSDKYYPDLRPGSYAYDELTAAASAPLWTAESLREKTLDDYLWFNGYLYRLAEDGYFVMDETVDSLYFGPDGQYTSGNAELDAYVADTLTDYMTEEQPRLEYLRAIYYHVKNDFRYLVRNIYPSGATGWEIDEALTMYLTGKGNCYCYTSVFWSLARGLGYDATAYSGTIGIHNQPHAWTEISLDDKIYICDPEIEKDHLVWQHEYTNNFMMLREYSGGWNYQSVGRK